MSHPVLTTNSFKFPQRPLLEIIPRMHLQKKTFLALQKTTDPVLRCRQQKTDTPKISAIPCLTSNYRSSSLEHLLISSLPGERKSVATARMKELKMKVRQMLRSASGSDECLNLVDRLKVLGLEHHFCEEIECALRKAYRNLEDDSHRIDGGDLHFACLRFRLLREHGWNLSQGFLDRFKDSAGRLNHDLTEDWKGLLSLYEASYLGTDQETSLKEARSFVTTHLKEMAVKVQSRQARKMIQYALEKPLHHRLRRFEATHHINEMSKDDQSGDLHGTLIELAKLDLNYTQSLYREELKEMTK